MFLSPSEVHELTGRAKPGAQRRELTRMGIKFLVNCVGRPIVCRSEVESKASSRGGERKTTPDLGALRETMNGGTKKKN